MARGVAAQAGQAHGTHGAHCVHSAEGTRALEMTKWFDTNYPYLLPEFDAATQFHLNSTRLFDEVAQALALGHPVKAVLLGPLSFLWLGNEKQARPGPVHAARSAAARVGAGAGPSEGAGRGLGADGRAGAGPGSARCLAPCVRARLLATAPQRTPVDAGDLLFAARRKPAHGVPIARRRTACRCGARPGGTTGRRRLAAGAQSAVRRHRRWPQHLAQRPGRGARAPADGARQTPGRTLDCAVVLAAACAIEPGRRAAVGRRDQVLARLRQ